MAGGSVSGGSVTVVSVGIVGSVVGVGGSVVGGSVTGVPVVGGSSVGVGGSVGILGSVAGGQYVIERIPAVRSRSRLLPRHRHRPRTSSRTSRTGDSDLCSGRACRSCSRSPQLPRICSVTVGKRSLEFA